MPLVAVFIIVALIFVGVVYMVRRARYGAFCCITPVRTPHAHTHTHTHTHAHAHTHTRTHTRTHAHTHTHTHGMCPFIIMFLFHQTENDDTCAARLVRCNYTHIYANIHVYTNTVYLLICCILKRIRTCEQKMLWCHCINEASLSACILLVSQFDSEICSSQILHPILQAMKPIRRQPAQPFHHLSTRMPYMIRLPQP